MGIDRADAAEQVRLLVWAAANEPAAIVEILCEEYYDPDDVSEEDAGWIAQEVGRAAAAKREAEKSWPVVSDWDRLDTAFAALDRAGIIALHQTGMTQSDGWGDVCEVFRERGGERSGATGYCFYHGQDVERALLDKGLMLAFGHILSDPAKGVDIGRRIVAELEAAGFQVAWNGSTDQRIDIVNMRWQKRGP
jgi:hypothetical protein